MGGSNSVTLTKEQMPSHTHGVSIPGGGNYVSSKESQFADAHAKTFDLSVTTGSTGGGKSHENRPPYIVMNYIIKVK